MRPAISTAIFFLILVACAHLLRVAFQVPVTVGDFEFPMAASGAGAVLIGALAFWLWREQGR